MQNTSILNKYILVRSSGYKFQDGYCVEQSGGPPRTELYATCNDLPTRCTRDDCENLCKGVKNSNPVKACEYAGNTHNCVAIHGTVTEAKVTTEDKYECAIIGMSFYY